MNKTKHSDKLCSKKAHSSTQFSKPVDHSLLFVHNPLDAMIPPVKVTLVTKSHQHLHSLCYHIGSIPENRPSVSWPVSILQREGIHTSPMNFRLASCHSSSPPSAPIMHTSINCTRKYVHLHFTVISVRAKVIQSSTYSQNFPLFLSYIFFNGYLQYPQRKVAQGQKLVSFSVVITLAFNTISEHTRFFIHIIFECIILQTY